MKKILKVLLSLLMAFGLLTIIPADVYAASSVKLEDGSYVTAEKVTVSSKEMYSYAYEVLNLINKERKSAGLSSLTMDKSLLTSAMTRAKETSIYYSHTRPTGAKFSTAFTKSGSLAENIAAGQSSASQVVSSWMNSSSHKANILGSKYKSIGIGCVYVNGCYYWTQLFSSNSATSVSQPSNQSTNTSIAFSTSTIKPTLSLTSSIAQNATTTVSYQFNNGFKTMTIDNQYLKFSSSDTSVATVSSTGVITGKKAGTVTITVTPKESTSYKLTKTIKVTGSSSLSNNNVTTTTSISKMTASLSQTSYIYDGTAKKPSVKLKNGSTTLKNGTDYTVSYSNNTNVGTATVKITGKGSYTGTLTKTFTINKASYTPTVKSYTGTYDGQSHTITISNVKSGSTIKYKTSSSASYTSTKPSRTSTGTTTVYYQITNANYKTITGSAQITINANTKNISQYTATLSKTIYTYTGKALKPTVTLKNGSTTISSSNYTVTYSNNTNIGTATVTIKGKGNYTGTITKTFTINPTKTAVEQLTAKSKAITVKVSLGSTQASGYEIQYATNCYFKNAQTKTSNDAETQFIKLSGLLSKKTYFVRARRYKTVNGKKYYSDWSSYKSVQTK